MQLVKKGLSKGNEILNEVQTPEQYNAVMSGIKKGTDALGIFPKNNPLVAIQTNIMNAGNTPKQSIDINFNFIGKKSKKDKKSDIVEAEILEN